MHYMGGKSRIAAKIVAELRKYYVDGMTYIEPFVGGANVIAKVDFAKKRIAGDIDPQLIRMWEAVSNGWVPPETLSEDEYKRLKLEQPDDPITGFAKYGCSFSGKAWGGYARGGYARGNVKRNYCSNAQRSVLKKSNGIRDVSWYVGGYADAPVTENCLVYCDPPYAGTTDYKTNFDHAAFWDKIREWSVNNTVLVSEYTAPDDFDTVWQSERVSDMRDASNTRFVVTEKLFKWSGKC